jgi:hypothetical protein
VNANLQKYLDESPKLRAAAEADMRRKADAEAPFAIHQAIEQAPPVKRVKALEAYAASSLYGVHLERPPLIIQGIIPAGLSVLAGAPKRGKSWLALAMGIAVATGADFLGMGARKGDVLYMDLESRQYRVQDRLGQLMPGNFPERLWITHDAQAMNAGLLDQLGEWCQDHPQTSLIVIDTLGRVKGGGRRAENAYEADTRIFGELQKFAQSHRLAVVCVHHLRKSNGRGEDSDPVERISGSMGLAGVCDAIMLLDGKRGEAESTLSITARDFARAEYVLRFEGGVWALQSADVEAWREEQSYVRSGVVRGLLALMKQLNPPEWKGTASQLLEAMQGASYEPLGIFDAKQLGRELEQVTRKLYERDGVAVRSKRTGKARELYISQSPIDEF